MIAIRISDSHLSTVAICMIGIVSLAGCSSPAKAPTEFADYNSPGGTFACVFPNDWQTSGGGGRGLEWAKAKAGSAEIKLEAGVAGSLMAGPGGGNTGQLGIQESAPELEPVHAVHALGKKGAEDQFSGYKEVGEVEVVECALGPARRSEFTAASTFGGGLHGYRATALGKDKAVYVYCVCPESDWKTLEPAFDRVLLSMKRGQAE
jgi:hypothetical protein